MNPSPKSASTDALPKPTFPQRLFGWVPIVGNLTRCSGQNHLEAFKEWGVNIVVAFLPILLAWVIIRMRPKYDENFPVWWEKTIENGDLTLVAAGLVGQIAYLANKGLFNKHKYYGNLFYSQVGVNVSTLLIFALVFTIYGLKVGVNELDVESMSWFTIITCSSSLLIFFSALVYNLQVDDNTDNLNEQSKVFTEQLGNIQKRVK
jgi:hypothetical protein